MDEFELLRNVTIGQYLPTGSVLHRLDPRVKIMGLVLLMIVLVAYPSASGLIVGLAVVLGLVALARVSLGFVLGGLAPALPVMLFLALLQLLLGWGLIAHAGCRTLWAWNILSVTTCSVQAVIVLLVRFTALIVLVSLLTLTSTITELTRGAESLMRPLQRVGVPADELAMVFTLALRFVPTLAQEMEKLLKAQASRGADIRRGSNPIQRTRQLLPVLVPLFITTLRRADELTLAMEARGYTGGQGRTRYVRLHFRWTDLAALLVVAGVVVGLLVLPFGALDQLALAWLANMAGR
jgi:energy-coupling factor transport system permease protein